MSQEQKNTQAKSSFRVSELLASLKKASYVALTHLGFIVVIIMLAIIGYSITQTSSMINEATDTEDSSTIVKSIVPSTTSFNKTTIEQVNRLSDQDRSSDISLPGGRINPFSE
ncbi:hypothetical protein B7Z28_01355 [Candidatus Saccharibacteria bacterium 32-45-3]|nr:MAG: hypothetical protein B7Z28_01355 [Candidatus Saccharibacteria bacterium 32-45-3]